MIDTTSQQNITEIMKVVKFIGGDITIDWGDDVVMKINVIDGSFLAGHDALVQRIQQIKPMLVNYDVIAFKLIGKLQVITFGHIN